MRTFLFFISIFFITCDPYVTTTAGSVNSVEDINVKISDRFEISIPVSIFNSSNGTSVQVRLKEDPESFIQLSLLDWIFSSSFSTDGTSRKAVTQGNYAFVAARKIGLMIFNITLFEKISLLSYIDVGFAEKLDIQGDYVYCASMNFGVRIIDVSDKSNPRIVSTVAVLEKARDVFVRGNYLYVSDDKRGMFLADVSDKLNPSEIGRVFCLVGATCETVGTYYSDDIAYISDLKDGFRIINTTIKSNPQSISIVEVRARNSHISENFAFIACGVDGLLIYDISNLTYPVQLLNYTEGMTNVRDVFAVRVSTNQTTVYIADWTSGFHILNMTYIRSNNTNRVLRSGGGSGNGNDFYGSMKKGIPFRFVITNVTLTPISSYLPNNFEKTVSLTYFTKKKRFSGSGNDSFIALSGEDKGLVILNVTRKDNIEIVSRAPTLSTTSHISLSDDRKKAFLAGYRGGIWGFDISDRDSPILEFVQYVDDVVFGIDVRGDYIYVCANSLGLFVYDWKKREFVGSYNTEGNAWDVMIDESGDIAYVADKASGWVALNISNVLNVTLISSTPCNPAPKSVAVFVRGNHLFVSQESSGVTIFEVSNPKLPQNIVTVSCSGKIKGAVYVDPQKRYLFITDYDDHIFEIYDISVIDSPKKVYRSSVALIGIEQRAIYYERGNMFIGDVNNGVEVFNFTNRNYSEPQRINVLSSDNVYNFQRDDDNYLFASNDLDGLSIFRSEKLKFFGQAVQCGNFEVKLVVNDRSEKEIIESFFVKVRHDECLDDFCNICKCGGVYSNETNSCGGQGNCTVEVSSGLLSCVCNDNYFGEECNVTTCGGLLSNDSSNSENICNFGNGSCVEYNKCSCFNESVHGDNCDIYECNKFLSNVSETVCNGNGLCVAFDTCVCSQDLNYTDRFCSTLVDANEEGSGGKEDEIPIKKYGAFSTEWISSLFGTWVMVGLVSFCLVCVCLMLFCCCFWCESPMYLVGIMRKCWVGFKSSKFYSRRSSNVGDDSMGLLRDDGVDEDVFGMSFFQ